jgi:hypothetical protein
MIRSLMMNDWGQREKNEQCRATSRDWSMTCKKTWILYNDRQEMWICYTHVF